MVGRYTTTLDCERLAEATKGWGTDDTHFIQASAATATPSHQPPPPPPPSHPPTTATSIPTCATPITITSAAQAIATRGKRFLARVSMLYRQLHSVKLEQLVRDETSSLPQGIASF